MDLCGEQAVDGKERRDLEPLRVRLERVLELVQVDRPEAASDVLAQMAALEREASGLTLGRFAEGAATAAGIALRWRRGVMTSDDARIQVLRLTLAMIRELGAHEGRR